MSTRPTYTDKALGWDFEAYVQSGRERGYFYEVTVVDGPASALITQNGRTLINFASINFLGLHTRPDVKRQFVTAAEKHGLATGGSRATQGISRAHYELERELCRVTGKDRAISFASGLLANIGFIHAVTHAMRFDRVCRIDNRDAVLILDRESHWSLFKAVEGLPFGKQLFTFRHNDPSDLEKVLSRVRAQRVVVVFESLYSVDGSIAPMGDILDLCEEYGALSYVDDANGFLVYGPEHRPFAKDFSAMPRATFIMVSFSKSVGLEGGAIAGPEDPIYALESLSGTSLFTAAMQPPTASTARYIMRLLQTRPHIMDGYLRRVEMFRRRLIGIGCVLNETPSYITSVLIGEDAKAEQVRQEFLERGFLVPVFRYPAVRRNKAIMRLILNASHSEDHIDQFVETLAEMRSIYEF